jgi:hypothetical protein
MKSMSFGFLGLVAGILLAAYILLLLFAWLGSDSMIFPAPPPSYGPEAVTHTLRTPEGLEIPVHLEPNPDAPFTLVYSHGNGEDLGHSLPALGAFAAHGFQAVAYDYPGYGLATGQANEANTYAAIQAVYAWLVDELGVAPGRILLYGRSLGSGPSLELASRRPVGGLILEGAFVSAFRVMTRVPLAPFDKFENEKKLQALSLPLLVIHGEQDQVVPFWHGRALHAASPAPNKTFLALPEAGHNDIQAVAHETYWQALKAFAESIKPLDTPEPNE